MTISGLSSENHTLEGYYYHDYPTATTNTTAEESIWPSWMATYDTVFTTAYMIEKCVGFAANLLTIISIIKFKKLSSQPSNIFIGSLALADSINFGAVPFEIFTLYPYILDISKPEDKRIMNIGCYGMSIFGIISFWGNGWHIFIIAAERFLSINFPLFMRSKVTVKSAKITVSILWTFIITKITFDFIFLNNGFGFDYCTWDLVLEYRIYDKFIMAPFAVISCFTLSFYIRIAYVTIKRSRKNKVRLNLLTSLYNIVDFFLQLP